MPRKKKKETIDDIIDRIEGDLETIRDKTIENQDWKDDIDEDEDEDEDSDSDDYYDEEEETDDEDENIEEKVTRR